MSPYRSPAEREERLWRRYECAAWIERHAGVVFVLLSLAVAGVVAGTKHHGVEADAGGAPTPLDAGDGSLSGFVYYGASPFIQPRPRYLLISPGYCPDFDGCKRTDAGGYECLCAKDGGAWW